MVLLSSAPALSSSDSLILYHTTDPDLSDAPILVFTGPAQVTGATALASSRIQSHVLTPAGLQSFPRLAISPSSPLYAAVNCLPSQDQGDEVSRGLAYSLLKYFNELPENTRGEWVRSRLSVEKSPTALELFGGAHAAKLASRMCKAPDTKAAARKIEEAFSAVHSSTADVDLVLPHGAIRPSVDPAEGVEASARFGEYAELVDLFGECSFIPTSKMRRAPSRPSPANRTRNFLRQQKEALRREICELLDTEESYVLKLDQLVNEIAAKFRQTSPRVGISSSNSDIDTLSALFPNSLDEILKANSGFLKSLLAAVESTETSAIEDIERVDSQPIGSSVTTEDPTGATDVAKCLLDWLPAFRECYERYIQAHAAFGSVLKSLMTETHSKLASKVHETGEQRLLSMLIEPVQRLPRYSLYLENIIKQLPLGHPALSPFLKAKDLVADLCVQDISTKIVANLRQLIKSWPRDFPASSRLISAVDLEEKESLFSRPGGYIGLLFASHFALVSKTSEDCVSARGLLAEAESPSALQTFGRADFEAENSLEFEEYVPLRAMNVLEMSLGASIRTIPTLWASDTSTVSLETQIRTFWLKGAYAERASRLARDFIKARTECRFPEQIRESGKWEVRELEADTHGLGLVTAVFEEDTSSRHLFSPAQIQIALEPVKLAVPAISGKDRPNIVASIGFEGNGFYRLEIESNTTQKTRDLVTCAEFLPVLTKRISSILQTHHSLRNPTLAHPLLRHHEDILTALQLPQSGRGRSPSKSRSSRPHSPVKALTNLFGGSSKDGAGHKKAPSTTELFEKPPVARPQLGPKAVPKKQDSSRKSKSAPKVVMASDSGCSGSDSIDTLEQCLANYLLALQARKGNVVGRVISNRATAASSAVAELNQSVLDQPGNNEVAANESVDVLFAAFEKFLKTSWRERLGPIIDCAMLDDLQDKSAIMGPMDYEDFLQTKLADLAPQNYRAFKAILELFMDLLSGMSNDGDRGALMATMAEIVVFDGRPHDYMSIFDRFVEEHDTILNIGARSGNSTPYQGSLASSAAARSAYTGSLSSKASSLGRRFGFHSSNENAKVTDTMLGSVFRSMSKSSRPGDGSVRDKHSLGRPKSVDISTRSSPRSRPGSKDGALVLETAGEPSSRPATSHSWDQLDPMESLRESEQTLPKPLRKKKRRSSLSDIESLPLPNTSPFWDTGTPSLRRPPIENSPLAPRALTATRDATPQLTPGSQTRAHLSMPLRRAGTVVGGHVPTPGAVRNSLLGSPVRNTGDQARFVGRKENISPTISEHPAGRFTGSVLSRGVLSERPGSGNTPPPAHASNADVFNGSPMKKSISRKNAPGQLSPQKLRERAQNQQAAITSTDIGLQAELAKIGEELAALNISTSPSKANVVVSEGMTEGIPTPRKTSATLQNISGRLKALEAKLPHMISSLMRQVDDLQKDVEATASHTAGSTSKAEELEKQLQQALGEIEVMHKRQTEDVQRIFEQNRRGRQQSEMERKMREAMDEAAKLRVECGALRRENAMLHAQGRLTSPETRG